MIVAAMLIGPGEGTRYLDRTLRCASQWADIGVAVLDGADEDTINAVNNSCLGVHWTVREPGTPSFREDESSVRNLLFECLDERCRDGDVIVILDADEELTHPTSVRQALEGLDDHHCWPVTFRHLWAPDGSVYRIDGGWAPAAGHRIYRHVRGGRVPPRQMACHAVPSTANPGPDVGLVMRHWGYARPHDRPMKYERYMELDGGRFHSLTHLQSIIEEATCQGDAHLQALVDSLATDG